MNDFKKQTEEMVKAARKLQVPESVQQIAEQNLQTTRKAYDTFSDAAHSTGKTFEKVYEAAQKGSKKLTEKVFENVQTNSEAAIELVEAVSQCKTFPEVAKVQADYAQKQLKVFSGQQKEIYELSNKLASEAFKTWNDATAKSINQLKASA